MSASERELVMKMLDAMYNADASQKIGLRKARKLSGLADELKIPDSDWKVKIYPYKGSLDDYVTAELLVKKRKWYGAVCWNQLMKIDMISSHDLGIWRLRSEDDPQFDLANIHSLIYKKFANEIKVKRIAEEGIFL